MTRDDEIARARQQREEQRVQETLILQKVNKTLREGFREKFPGQCEHSMRLVAERLQHVLFKQATTDLNDIDTWPATPEEIYYLTQSLCALYRLHSELTQETE